MNHEEKFEILTEAKDYCEKLYNGMNKLIKNIDERNLIDLEIYFKNIIEGFSWVLDVVVLVTETYAEKIDTFKIKQKINMCVEGYNNLDLLYVRDVVEYELMPIVESFYDILNNEIEK